MYIQLTCPKCGKHPGSFEECIHCGIIIQKYLKSLEDQQANKNDVAQNVKAETVRQDKPSLLIRAAALFVMVAAVVGVFFFSLGFLVSVFTDLKALPAAIILLGFASGVFYYTRKHYERYMSGFKPVPKPEECPQPKTRETVHAAPVAYIDPETEAIMTSLTGRQQKAPARKNKEQEPVDEKRTYGVGVYITRTTCGDPDENGWFEGVEEITDIYNEYMADPDNAWLVFSHHIGGVFRWLFIAYKDKKGSETVRDVFVIDLFEHREVIYFAGFCSLRQEIRTFKASNIELIADYKTKMEYKRVSAYVNRLITEGALI